MKFIDEVKIFVKSGDGGRGCVSFRREKYVPRGGPDGGNGGKGGDVILLSDGRLSTLLDLRYQQHYLAKRGGHGKGKNKHSGAAPDLIIPVPVGTVVKEEDDRVVKDFSLEGERITVARGGRGGRGNAKHARSEGGGLHYAEEGQEGEGRWLKLELKLLADVGIIGLPNSGKSTMISNISAARPRVADYPFTTLTPTLGVVKYGDYNSFVIADIPGLVEGAHQGVGLGIRFLRHIERTGLLLHLIDISNAGERDPVADFNTINNELAQYSPTLVQKPQVVAANKMDLAVSREVFPSVEERFNRLGVEIFPVSAITGSGMKHLIGQVVTRLLAARKEREM